MYSLLLCSDRGPWPEQHVTDHSAPAGGQDESPLPLGGLPSPSKHQHWAKGWAWHSSPVRYPCPLGMSLEGPGLYTDAAVNSSRALAHMWMSKVNFRESFLPRDPTQVSVLVARAFPNEMSHQPESSILYKQFHTDVLYAFV